jgi:hypothetical protein
LIVCDKQWNNSKVFHVFVNLVKANSRFGKLGLTSGNDDDEGIVDATTR